MPSQKGNSFYDVVTEAVDDLLTHGFDTVERLVMWEKKIKEAAEKEFTQPHVLEAMLRGGLIAIYTRMVEKGGIARYHAGVGRFTIERLRPHLRAELDRRILASANLIRLNRQQSIEKTLQRFSGWATSIPKGGTKVAGQKPAAKQDIRKSLARTKFEERRVLIDQGHKLTSAINDIVAKDNNALAMIWHSHWRQPGYNYREDHKERDMLVYTIRGNWALEQGLMRQGNAGFLDKITQPAEEPFCRCYGQYVYHVRDLPKSMLTAKGEKSLKEAQAKVREMVAGL